MMVKARYSLDESLLIDEQRAMARYYGEQDGDHDDSKPAKKMSKAEKLLSREFWRGQLHGGGGGNSPVHAMHMRSRCSVIPEGMVVHFTLSAYSHILEQIRNQEHMYSQLSIHRAPLHPSRKSPKRKTLQSL